MTPATRSRLAAAAADSRFLRSAATVATVIAGDEYRVRAAWASSVVGRTVSRLTPLDETDAGATADDSWLLRHTERFLTLCIVAWRRSSVRRWVDTSYRSQPAETRIALAGWMALSASFTRIALVGFDGLLGAPGTGVGWLVLPLPALICIARPQAVAAAIADGALCRSRRGAPDRP